jgi:membrane protein required for colicin V production
MELYDWIFLIVLAASCIAGIMRGGVKELVNLISFFLALFVSVASAPALQKMFQVDLLMAIFLAFLLYLLIYFGIRFLGHSLAERIQKQKALNAFDRALGFSVGFFRTLAVLGVFHLLFVMVTPKERWPEWFADARVHPLGERCAKAVQAFIPDGIDGANRT